MTSRIVCVFVLNCAGCEPVSLLFRRGGDALQVWKEMSIFDYRTRHSRLSSRFRFRLDLCAVRTDDRIASFGCRFLGIRQLNTTNLELQQTNRELLELMIKSIEARDPYTSGHSRRVKEYAIQIARLMGYDAATVEKIGTAALFTTSGRFTTSTLRFSRRRLASPEEWAIIKEHPADGANLIATMTRLRELVPAVMHHHENWDGTGYPKGLKGTEIPLASRVIMFADTFDAMTTKRPYRGPLGEAEVRGELVRCRGESSSIPRSPTDCSPVTSGGRCFRPQVETPTPRFLSLIGDGRNDAARSGA